MYFFLVSVLCLTAQFKRNLQISQLYSRLPAYFSIHILSLLFILASQSEKYVASCSCHMKIVRYLVRYMELHDFPLISSLNHQYCVQVYIFLNLCDCGFKNLFRRSSLHVFAVTESVQRQQSNSTTSEFSKDLRSRVYCFCFICMLW